MFFLTDPKACFGCGACAGICPHRALRMRPDAEGFLYPELDADRCIGCGLCEKACPVLHIEKRMPLHVYAAKARDKVRQRECASGGAFTTLAEEVVAGGGIVFGAAYTPGFEVEHCGRETSEGIRCFRGSKYAQSSTADTFAETRQRLQQGRNVLYAGTSCQIMGLRNFLRKTYPNLYTVDILCHGVPSPLLLRNWIEHLTRKYRKRIVGINMKDKTAGWGRQSPRVDFSDGTSLFGTAETLVWNQLFYSNLILRPACHRCPFASIERCADLTVGDYWGIERVAPGFHDENGVSLLLVNTEKGAELLEACAANLQMLATTAQECLQPNLLQPTPQNDLRPTFWKLYASEGFAEAVRICCGTALESHPRRVLKRIKHLFAK